MQEGFNSRSSGLGTGTASLVYFERAHHAKFMKGVKSDIGKQRTDPTNELRKLWMKKVSN